MGKEAIPPGLTDAVQEVLIDQDEIRVRISELGEQISRDYAQKSPLLVGVLKGVIIFMADLLRAISIPVEVDFMAISSYSGESRDRGLVRLVKDLETPITGRHVLFIEDVVDTGLTLNYLLRNLQARGPSSLEVCTLFNKSTHRFINIPLKYVGFELPDKFVIGYGLDHREKYRNLPFVGILKPQYLFGSKKTGTGDLVK